MPSLITELDIEVKKQDPYLEVMARASDIFAKYACGELAESPNLQVLTFDNTESNSIWTLTRRLLGEATNNQVSLTLIIDSKDETMRGMASVADIIYCLDEDDAIIAPTITSTNGLLDAELVLLEGGATDGIKAINFLLLLDTIDEQLSLK